MYFKGRSFKTIPPLAKNSKAYILKAKKFAEPLFQSKKSAKKAFRMYD